MPGRATAPGFRDAVLTTLAAIRATAQVAAIPGAAGAVPQWETLRETLTRLFRYA